MNIYLQKKRTKNLQICKCCTLYENFPCDSFQFVKT